MKLPLNFEEAKSRRSKIPGPLSFKLAAVLASICVGAGLLLPTIKSHNANHHAMPPGQFRADMRTLVAAVRYLLAPEVVVEKHPVFAAGTSAGITHLSPGQTPEKPDPAHPQTDTTIGPPPNPPAPI